MKILFASLSRIGDYIQHMVFVKAWAEAHPATEVHVLVNDLISPDLMRMNSQFRHIVLPRFEYQRKINQFAVPLLEPFWSLRKIVGNLREEKYDQLFDLSFQAHSLAFLRLVEGHFQYSEKEKRMINQYLDPSEPFHLIDKLKQIHGISISPRSSVGLGTKRLLLQVATSDVKKNIDLPRWKYLVDRIKSDYKSIDLKIVSSRNEAKKLEQIFQKSEVFVCGFTELSQVLDSETKLISLDTSIKHFAAQFQVPTVEVSVGSSHWIKNAAYQSGNFIFSAQMECRPCLHSVACPFGRNQCQDRIDFSELSQFVGEWIGNCQPTIFPMITSVQDRNLIARSTNTQQGGKWNQKANPTNLYL